MVGRASVFISFILCIALTLWGSVKASAHLNPRVPLPPPALHVVYHVMYTVARQVVGLHAVPITAECW